MNGSFQMTGDQARAASKFLDLAVIVSGKSKSVSNRRYSHKRLPRVKVMACVLLKEYLGLTFRSAVDLLKLHPGLIKAAGLAECPSHPTLMRLKRATPLQELTAMIDDVLKDMSQELRSALAGCREMVASAGSLYYVVRHVGDDTRLKRVKHGRSPRDGAVEHGEFIRRLPIVHLSDGR